MCSPPSKWCKLPGVAPVTDRLVTRGVSVRVRRAGTGAPLLFLHGGGGWPPWLPFFERLSQHYALTVPEHPGFGRRTIRRAAQHRAGPGDVLSRLLDERGSMTVHVVGHSLGGWAAAEASGAQLQQNHELRPCWAGRHSCERPSKPATTSSGAQRKRRAIFTTTCRSPTELEDCRRPTRGSTSYSQQLRQRQVRPGAAPVTIRRLERGCIASPCRR